MLMAVYYPTLMPKPSSKSHNRSRSTPLEQELCVYLIHETIPTTPTVLRLSVNICEVMGRGAGPRSNSQHRALNQPTALPRKSQKHCNLVSILQGPSERRIHLSELLRTCQVRLTQSNPTAGARCQTQQRGKSSPQGPVPRTIRRPRGPFAVGR